jgi:Domain of unknown function (DUF1707)
MSSTPAAGSGSSSNRIRLTDRDRDELAELLGRHTATGTLSTEELERRLEAVFAAESREEVAPLLADLPPLDPSEPPRRAGWGRGHAEADAPGPGWTPTNERFRDPRTQRILRVWVDPASGARHYVPDRSE